MKLDRRGGEIAALVAVLAIGCGGATSSKRPETVTSTPVSTTRVMAAELDGRADAPKVGKSQHADESVVDEEAGKKDESHRRGERKPGGGFSGYK